MAGPSSSFGRREPLRRVLGRDTRGVAALEFAIVAPLFTASFLSILGIGLIGFYQTALDDAVRDAARQIQMATDASKSASGFVAAVCTGSLTRRSPFGPLAPNCAQTLTYSVQAGDPSGPFSALTPRSLSASGRLGNDFFASRGFARSAPVLVQVAYPLPFTIPVLGGVATATGTNSILATATVRAEP